MPKEYFLKDLLSLAKLTNFKVSSISFFTITFFIEAIISKLSKAFKSGI